MNWEILNNKKGVREMAKDCYGCGKKMLEYLNYSKLLFHKELSKNEVAVHLKCTKIYSDSEIKICKSCLRNILKGASIPIGE